MENVKDLTAKLMNKFSGIEIFNDESGKTSMTRLLGFIVTIIGCFGYVAGVVAFFMSKYAHPEVMTISAGLILTGLTVVTTNKIVEGKSLTDLVGGTKKEDNVQI